MKLFYRPSLISLIIDLMILVLSVVVVFEWFPLTTQNPYEKYDGAGLLYFGLWAVFSYLFGRFRPLHTQKYLKASFKLMYVTLLIFMVSWGISYHFYGGTYSIYVIFTYTTVIFGVYMAFYMLYFALLYAVEFLEKPESSVEVRENAQVRQATPLDEESYRELCEAIIQHSGIKTMLALNEKFDLRSGNTLVNFSSGFLDIKAKQNYKFSTIIQLERLNNVRGINTLFATVNAKLPDNGLFVCCFESKSTRKKRILAKYPPGFNYVFYVVDFIFKRFMPKVFLTRRLCYDITRGKNRILSKTEVLGRLYYCGYEIVNEKKIGKLTYVTARRIKQPEPKTKKSYGPLIKLRRMGKNREIFEVYKMRTMHPYSEYLQAYIYERNSLQEGGKFNKDIRVTTLGRFMRKYWLDELPMIFNLLMGDMKIVGVRPLSAHYFSLYSEELQNLRVKFKPGLLPPFYADMPKTMDEIQASEMKYLRECEKYGCFRTDIKYFVLILTNIFIKKARSA